jgi:hypothetical protein
MVKQFWRCLKNLAPLFGVILLILEIFIFIKLLYIIFGKILIHKTGIKLAESSKNFVSFSN